MSVGNGGISKLNLPKTVSSLFLFSGISLASFPFYAGIPQQPWGISKTSIFRPFDRDEVTIDDSGDVYFFESGQSTIYHYAADGAFVGTLCRAGSGPGEVRRILRVWVKEDIVYVLGFDHSKIQVFTTDGRFIEQIKFPAGQIIIPQWAQGGWLYVYCDFVSPDIQLILSDREFKTAKTLLTWESSLITQDKDTPLRIKMDLTADAAKIITSQEGSLIYLYLPGKPVIHVRDGMTGEEQRQIALDIERLPIDDDWVERKIETSTPENSPVTYEFSAGDYFPFVKMLRMGPRGNLLVYTSRHFVKEDEVPLVFDRQGRQTQTEFSGPALMRIVAIRDDMAYVKTFDPVNEEAGLAKMPTADVNRFVAEHPLP